MKGKNKSGLKKKGVTLGFDMVYWIIRIVFFTIVVVTLIFLIKILQVDNINVDHLQNYVLQNRILYAYDGISYLDLDTNRVYPGIISTDGLSDKVSRILDLGEYQNYLAIKFDLVYFGKTQTYYYNQERYTLLEPLVNIKGPGGAKSITYENDVLVCDKGNCLTQLQNLKGGKLLMEILRPNS